MRKTFVGQSISGNCITGTFIEIEVPAALGNRVKGPNGVPVAANDLPIFAALPGAVVKKMVAISKLISGETYLRDEKAPFDPEEIYYLIVASRKDMEIEVNYGFLYNLVSSSGKTLIATFPAELINSFHYCNDGKSFVEESNNEQK